MKPLRIFALSLIMALVATPLLLRMSDAPAKDRDTSARVPFDPQVQPLPSLAPILKQASPAVVKIATVAYQELPNHPFLNDPFFRRFFDIPQQNRRRESQGLGSGVILDAGNGYIVTNQHVIAGADQIKVMLDDDREFPATLIGNDPQTDLALLKIEADGLTAIPLANSEDLLVGDFVIAIGNPFGLRHTATMGIVSALGRSGIGRGIENFIQTDAPINPGNSGGALVNLRGELVGINTMIYSQSGGSIGIGFAIPINLARNVMEQLVEFGEVQRGSLGVVTQDITPELARAFELKDNRGALVTQVIQGSPAAAAGVQPGDVIIAVNKRMVTSSRGLRNAVGLIRLGDMVHVAVVRDGEERILSGRFSDTPPTVLIGAELHPKLAGATFSLATPSGGQFGAFLGVAVTSVTNNSQAWQAGLRDDDLILEVDQVEIRDVNDLRRAVDGTERKLLLLVQRGRRAYYVTIR